MEISSRDVRARRSEKRTPSMVPSPMPVASCLPAVAHCFGGPAGRAAPGAEFLSRVRRLTVEGRRPEKATGRPTASGWCSRASASPATFYQIYALDFASGDTSASPGYGKTTCSFFRPGTDQILFASTHHDARSKALQQESWISGHRQGARYSWTTTGVENLRVCREEQDLHAPDNARGYDAEGATLDGQWIAFSSMRDAYNRPLSAAEQKQLEWTRATSPRSTSCARTERPGAADQRGRL